MNKLIPAALLTLASCSFQQETCIDAPDIKETLSVEIERLEDQLFASKSYGDVLVFLNDQPLLTEEFLGADQYPSDTILAKELYRIISNPFTDTLLMEAKRHFGDMADIKAQFEQAFSYIHYYYPDFKTPKIKTIVTGFGGSEMYVGEKEIIIGLDFYLGPKGKYQPQGIPQYILKRYDKPYIVPAVILLYANRYLNEESEDNAMLADMIYYGKKFYFAKNMMPCTPDSLLIWYDGEELANVKDNRNLLWYHFLENELLFETNHIIKKKYMDERPNITEIGSECPGRIGAWIGWDIVKSYEERNEEVTLQQLMANPNAQAILEKAKYNPM